jgi:hypothetical protein
VRVYELLTFRVDWPRRLERHDSEEEDMKILAVPDVHGTHHWEKAREKIGEVDRVIFLGDYFDGWENSWPDQMDNFHRICEFREENQDKVDLCVGNHELHYLIEASYSGKQRSRQHDIREAVRRVYRYLRVIYEYDGWLFSHAGLSTEWMRDLNVTEIREVNQMFRSHPDWLDWVGPNGYGDNPNEGPLWIRPRALLNNAVPGHSQCVGHTENEATIGVDVGEDRIVFVDTADHDNLTVIDTSVNL